MIDFENFMPNLDIIDSSDVRSRTINKSLLVDNKNNEVLKAEVPPPTFNRPLAAAVLGVNNTDISLDELLSQHCWSDIDAQHSYLCSKPTSYVIIGKPSVGTYSIGEVLSKRFNCYHICPRNLILEEISQGRQTGKCLNFNLRHGAKIQYKLLLDIMKIKLESETVKHKGYVLSGLPLVDSIESDLYLIENLYPEEAFHAVEQLLLELIANLKKKKTKPAPKLNNFGEEMSIENEEEQEPEDLEEEDDKPVVIPKYLLDLCSGLIVSGKVSYKTKHDSYLEQITQIFNLAIKPDIIIYVTCSDADVIEKKGFKYMNYTTSGIKYTQLNKDFVKDIRWPTLYSVTGFENPRERSSPNIKYNCKHPINFQSNAINQLCNYRKNFHPLIEKIIYKFDPRHVINVDGALPVYEIVYNIIERLVLLPVQPVLTPEPLLLPDVPENISELWETLENFNPIKDGVLKFNRYASYWQNRCPVELEKGKTEIGRPKFAVGFFKHVYLLSSEEAMIKFIKNPRPYLQTPLLEPKCRVIVLGTPSSGKTMISHCLSWLFEAPIIDYRKHYEEQSQKKFLTFAQSILPELQPILQEKRLSIWQNNELQRLSGLDEWLEKVHSTLKKYLPFLEKRSQSEDVDTSYKKKMDYIKKEIIFLPFLDDVDLCKSAILNKELLIQYAPSELTDANEKPKVPLINDEDTAKEIEAYIDSNQLRDAIAPTPEELIKEFSQKLSTYDTSTKHHVDKYGRWIIEHFPLDAEYWTLLEDFKILPDYTIGLLESREIEPELLRQYDKINKSLKNYSERFPLADDTLIKIKLMTNPPTKSTLLDVQMLLTDIINDVFDILRQDNVLTDDDSVEFEKILRENVEQFGEHWETIKLKLEEVERANIEVSLEQKSDIQVVEEVLLQLRKAYIFQSVNMEDDESVESIDDKNDLQDDSHMSNDRRFLGDVHTYCPVTYFDHNVLWEGKPDFSVQYNRRNYYFANEKNLNEFQNDPTKYQKNARPFRKIPSFKICVVGSVGSGKTTLSKFLSKELGLLHIDFEEFINNNLIPRHFQKVGRRYENSFTDTKLDDASVTEFQIDEESDFPLHILSNEKEMRRSVYNYFERGTPLNPAFIQKLIKKIWFGDPYSSIGFVLDGFPRLPTDLEEMFASYCVPDLIIQLNNSLDTTLKRLSGPMFQKWKYQLNEAKAKARAKFALERKNWLDSLTKEIVVELIISELIHNSVVMEEVDYVGPEATAVLSDIIDADPMGSLNVDLDLFQHFNSKIENNPEPVDTNEWPSVDEARENIDSRLEALYETDNENLGEFEELLSEQKIKLITIDADKSLDNVKRIALTKLNTLRKRNQSFLEQTILIGNDVAETLLSQGVYFLSRFIRMCPVYIFENPGSIHNPYKVCKTKNRVFPIAHRCYIYFINSVENVRKFRSDPLKYVISNLINYYIEYPLRIAVIGPPKSGKSTIAAKLASRYGLMCLSKGSALRHVLENLPWTKVASKIFGHLEKGKMVPNELIINVIQTLVSHYKYTTHGIVYDGFPYNAAECATLHADGLYPSIVFDLQCSKEKVLSNLEKDIHYNILKYLPPYPNPYISFRYDQWKINSKSVGRAIDFDYKNRFQIQCTDSRWQCLHSCKDILAKITPEIHYYLNNVNEKAVSVAVMLNSKQMVNGKLSNYKKFCPVCFHNNKLNCSKNATNWEGMIEHENKYFWICSKHIKQVLNLPQKYLICQNVILPEVPAIINNVDTNIVYENGVCVVTYAHSLPSIKIVSGDSKYAVAYKRNHYLFCSKECLERFFEQPLLYHDIVIFKDINSFPSISLKKLPNLGYLEQTLGNLLTEVCCLVNAVRPKYPGLSACTSALIFIALWLKTHNPAIKSGFKAKYEKAGKIFTARCKLILDIGLRLRSSDNPFAQYPECCRSIGSSELGSNPKRSYVSSWSTYSGTGSEFREKNKDVQMDFNIN